MMNKVLLSYVPVLHEGYFNFLKRFSDSVDFIYVLGNELIQELDYLHKEIRALHPNRAVDAIASWKFFSPDRVQVIGRDILVGLQSSGAAIVMPDEDICRQIYEKYLRGCPVEFFPVFLRWNRDNATVNKEVLYDKKILFKGLAGEMMGLAFEESLKAPNWWRQVGAVITKQGKVVLAGYNRHVPSPHMPYIEGDPRNCFKRGLNIEVSTDFHAEARLITEAARRGISLEGTDLYVTTFPCPPCAKLIAYSGIRRCFFSSGYAMLDGERILRQNGVRIIFVEEK